MDKGTAEQIRLDTMNVQEHQFTSPRGAKATDGGVGPESEIPGLLWQLGWGVWQRKVLVKREGGL